MSLNRFEAAKRGRSYVVSALVLAFALSFATVAPAAAQSSYGGDRTCTGAKLPRLVLNSNGGSGTWWKHGTSGTVNTPFTFTSGVVFKYSPYQSAHWSVWSTSWYATPYADCQ